MINDNCIKVSILTNDIYSSHINNNLLLTSMNIPSTFNLNNTDNIKFLKKIVVKSKYYIILHIRSSVRYKYIQYYFKVIIFIFHGITTSISIGSFKETIFFDKIYTMMIIIAILNILSSILISLIDFFKLKEKIENHKNISNNWIKFIKKTVLEIDSSISINKSKITEIYAEYNHIIDHSPHISKIIIYDFLKHKKKSFYYEYFLFPLGCVNGPIDINYSVI